MSETNVIYARFGTKRKFGVEIETDGLTSIDRIAAVISEVDKGHPVHQSTVYEQDYNNDYWHVKFDRSCGVKPKVGGWEVASYVAKGYKDIFNIAEVVNALQKKGVTCNDNCAFHIHACVGEMKFESVATVIAHWIRIEKLLCESVPVHRRNNKYCRMLGKRYAGRLRESYDPYTLWQVIHPINYNNAERRVTLNYCNYAQGGRKTLELRLPEGTLDSTHIRNWIRLFIRFVEHSSSLSFPKKLSSLKTLEDVLPILGLQGKNSFFILSKALRETKLWFLSRILAFSESRSLRKEAKEILELMTVYE